LNQLKPLDVELIDYVNTSAADENMDEIVDLVRLEQVYLSVSLHDVGQFIVRHVFDKGSLFGRKAILRHEGAVCMA
jgi:hypothetical protein